MKDLVTKLKIAGKGLGTFSAEEMSTVTLSISEPLIDEMLKGDINIVPDEFNEFVANMRQEQKIFLINAYCYALRKTSQLQEELGVKDLGKHYNSFKEKATSAPTVPTSPGLTVFSM